MRQKKDVKPQVREGQPSRLILFPQGPPIAILARFNAGQLESLVLEEAPSYRCYHDEELPPALLEYFKNYGAKENCEPFDLRLVEKSTMTLFQRRVYRAMQRVPFGEVLSYGEVAAKIGQPRAARAVGTACRCNPFQLLIPCHRVVAAQGKIGGYAAGLDLKKVLLEFEGTIEAPNSPRGSP